MPRHPIPPPQRVRKALEIHRKCDVPFDEAWTEALRVCRGEWREPIEWAKPIFRDAYERTGQRFKLSEGMLEEVVV